MPDFTACCVPIEQSGHGFRIMLDPREYLELRPLMIHCRRFPNCCVRAARSALCIALILMLCSCIGTRLEYSTKSLNPGLYATKYNHVLHLGVCGMPWNYDRIYYIKLLKDDWRLQISDFEIRGESWRQPLSLKSGYIYIDRIKRYCDIDVKISSIMPDG